VWQYRIAFFIAPIPKIHQRILTNHQRLVLEKFSQGPNSFESGLKYGCSTGTGDKALGLEIDHPVVGKQGWGGEGLQLSGSGQVDGWSPNHVAEMVSDRDT